MRAVNLLPADQLGERRGPPPAIVVGCAGAVLSTAVLAGGYLQASSKVGAANTELARLDAQLTAVPKPVEVPTTVTTLPQERQARVAALTAVLSQRVAWDRILREVSLVLPDDVWLSSLQARSPVAAAPGTVAPLPAPGAVAAVDGFTLKGFTYSQAGVARLLSRLAVVPDLKDVQLSEAITAEAGESRVISFTILGNVRPTGGQPAS